ncbi:putative sodium-dependent transporter yocS [Morus notabilis]|uniref:Putative sodium-dependent transporter yocS n=1 Tax=Morus notabilis TaxID=981085 RepID=W9QDD2_9ROSA|nr:putative sodium-dependent transporter yocS [Morus notabilis]
MSISFRLSPFSITSQQQQQRQQSFFISQSPQTLLRRRPSFSPLKKITNPIRAVVNGNNSDGSASLAQEKKPRWENVLSTAASLYPVYVSVGGVVACGKPSAFAWFVKAAPASYSAALGLIMLAMGITLELKDFLALFWQKPLSILFGCVAQYTIMPSFAAIISKILGLPPSLSVGLILLGCCPGGTASNVVTLIAQGDVPLSIVMTVCTTLGAVVLTPLLTKILAGAYVPVDAVKLSLSTLQVVVAPILVGSYIQSAFPGAVKLVMPFAPLFAVLASSLLACRYISAASCGFKERQRRAISVEVGMQNSSLGVVLATSHFTSPMVALPAAMSAVIMNIMGSSLGFFWRYVDPSDSKNSPKVDK